MSDKNYAVPEDGLKAILFAVESDQRITARPAIARLVLEAFIRWQSENPPVPEWHIIGQMIADYRLTHKGCCDTEVMRDVATEYVRRMYLAPEPEVPEDVQAFWNVQPDAFARKQILAAYWLGKASR